MTQLLNPTTPCLKIMAACQTDTLRAALKTACDTRMREPRAERWLQHCDDYKRMIDYMASEVAKIPDDAPQEQALAQMRRCLASAEKLGKKIALLRAGVETETV